MKFIDLTIPLGIGTPPWPTYEPLQVKYFKRLAPNGANGQVLTHSNHVGTHLDGEIHFYTPGKDIAQLDFDFLAGEAAIVDLSDVCGDYDIYTPDMIEERVEVKEHDILIIHTGYHHFGWDQPYGNEMPIWSCTPALTPASRTGARRKSSNGSGLTAAAPIIP
jgi:kynurenine formamidase